MHRHRINGFVAGSVREGKESAPPLRHPISHVIRCALSAAAIPSFCFESKRFAGDLAGFERFDSKQNAELNEVPQRFDSKQKAAFNYRRWLSQQVMNAQARSRAYCAQRKGEMLMLS